MVVTKKHSVPSLLKYKNLRIIKDKFKYLILLKIKILLFFVIKIIIFIVTYKISIDFTLEFYPHFYLYHLASYV